MEFYFNQVERPAASVMRQDPNPRCTSSEVEMVELRKKYGGDCLERCPVPDCACLGEGASLTPETLERIERFY